MLKNNNLILIKNNLKEDKKKPSFHLSDSFVRFRFNKLIKKNKIINKIILILNNINEIVCKN